MTTKWLSDYDDMIATLDGSDSKTKEVAETLSKSFKTVPGVDTSKVPKSITEDNAGDALNEMYNEVKAKDESQKAGRRRTRKGKGKKKSKKTRKSRR